jgi:hypothetical protein
MGNEFITCISCENTTQVNILQYRKILERFEALTKGEVNRQYLCRKCRAFHDRMGKCNVDKTMQYQQAQRGIQTEADTYRKRGLENPEARNNFIANVKTLLDRCNVTCYSFFIVEGKLKGIKIQIPFVGDVLMKLKIDK